MARRIMGSVLTPEDGGGGRWERKGKGTCAESE